MVLKEAHQVRRTQGDEKLMAPDAEIGDVFVADLTDVTTTLVGERSEI
jgi:hypothetical protein